MLGQAFCQEHKNTFGCIPVLSCDEKAMTVKYALGAPCQTFSSFDAGQKAFFLHNNFSHTDRLCAWMSEETLEAQLLYDFFPKLHKLYQQIVGGFYENSHTWVAVHGDIAHHNIVQLKGKACLIDWEWLALGPQEWDFTAVLLNEARYKVACSGREMIEGYKSMGGVVDLHNIQLMLSLREMLSVMYCLQLGKTNPSYQQEAFKRAQSIEEGSNIMWQRSG